MKYTLHRSIRRAPTRCLSDIYGWLRLRGHPALWGDIAKITSRSHSVGCSYHDLSVLYRHVVRHRPAYVLELGAGVSTLVLAHAAREVRDRGFPCTIVSMEEHPFYYEQLKSLFPVGVADCVEVILSPVKDRQINGRTARCYDAKPQYAYDLVFIDGPQVPKDDDYFDGDILDALNWNDKSFTAYLDGRVPTRENLLHLCPWAKVTSDKDYQLTRFEFPERSHRF